MSHDADEATLQALLDRLLKFRLPRAIDLKQRVDAGAVLSDADIAFLKVALEDAHNGQQYVVRNPEFHKVGTQLVQLYEQIVARAMENENSRGGR